MNRFVLVFLVGFVSSTFSGCGSSNTAAPVAEQDELKKYAAEHPHNDADDAGVDSGDGK